MMEVTIVTVQCKEDLLAANSELLVDNTKEGLDLCHIEDMRPWARART